MLVFKNLLEAGSVTTRLLRALVRGVPYHAESTLFSAQVLKSQVRVGWVGRSSEVSVPPATPPLRQCA